MDVTIKTTADLDAIAKLHHASKGKAERLIAVFASEYPGLALDWALDELGRVASWKVLSVQDGEAIWEGDKLPDLADVLDAAEDAGIDPEEGAEEDEDEDRSGSIVAQKYRDEYAARGNPNHCGDWLAVWLADRCAGVDAKGKPCFDVETFRSLLSANGVDMTAKWANTPETRGWQGRFRMSGRIALEKIVAIRGTVLTETGVEVRPDAMALADLRGKHAKAVAKAEKKTAEAA